MQFSKILFLIYCLILISCVSSRALKETLPDPDQFVKRGYGSWMTLTYQSENKLGTMSGEFIAIDSINLYLLTNEKMNIVDFNNITEAWLELHGDSKKDIVAGISIIGLLSTISHGYFLIFTAPLWLIVGSANASAESRADIYSQKNPSLSWWQDIKRFSRFPQGIPDGLQTDSLRVAVYPYHN